MCGRMANIVKAHNSLHSLMVQLNEGAKVISLHPRLQDHESSAEAVAVALTTMSAASTAGIMALGADVLQLSNTAAGSEKAAAFVAKHKGTAAAKPIPDDFWSELVAMGSLAGGDAAPNSVAHTLADADRSPSIVSAKPLSAPPPTRPLVQVKRSLSPSARTEASSASAASGPPQSSGQAKASASKPMGLKRMRK